MKIVRVTYTARLEYVEQNQVNIRNVMIELQKINNPDINYNCCLSPDGQLFTHLAFFNGDDAEKVLLTLPAFIYFQQQLKANGLDAPPRQELLTLIGTSKEIFN